MPGVEFSPCGKKTSFMLQGPEMGNDSSFCIRDSTIKRQKNRIKTQANFKTLMCKVVKGFPVRLYWLFTLRSLVVIIDLQDCFPIKISY